MTLSEILFLTKRYAVSSVIMACFLMVAFLVGYFIVYRKMMKKTEEFPIQKIGLSFMFIIYIMFILNATILNRYLVEEYRVLNLLPFSSYLQAWNEFSDVVWRNIILNIMLYVPMGLLLPLFSTRLRSFWKTCGIGLGISVVIEFIQYLLPGTLVEFDDVLNNTLGAAIGYGIITLIFYMIENRKRKEENSLIKVLCLQIPLLLSIIAFSTIFISYHKQELGNLAENYTYKESLRNVDVMLNTELNNSPSNASIYQAPVGTEADAFALANKILKQYETRVDETSTIIYPNAAVYYSAEEEGRSIVWVDYKGLKTKYINASLIGDQRAGKIEKERVLEILSANGVELPDVYEFVYEGYGSYAFHVTMQPSVSGILNGTFRCWINESDELISYDNEIISYQTYSDKELISEEEAFQRLKAGKFNYSSQNKIKTLEVKDVEMGYRMDSKGFYQPVYEFEAIINGINEKIVIAGIM